MAEFAIADEGSAPREARANNGQRVELGKNCVVKAEFIRKD